MIIAEIGQNHCGDMELAKKLIELARENGAGLVKFQLDAIKKPQHKDAELTKGQAFMLFNYGKAVGIEVFFSVFDVERVKWCEEMGVKRYKIACSQSGNKSLLGFLLGVDKPIIVSLPYPIRDVPIIGLHCQTLMCVPDYPAKTSDYLKYGDPAWRCFYDGISDHTIGLDASKIAIARGAEIIEKHFAIDHKTGVDAPWSMDAEELKELKRWETICKEVL